MNLENIAKKNKFEITEREFDGDWILWAPSLNEDIAMAWEIIGIFPTKEDANTFVKKLSPKRRKKKSNEKEDSK